MVPACSDFTDSDVPLTVDWFLVLRTLWQRINSSNGQSTSPINQQLTINTSMIRSGTNSTLTLLDKTLYFTLMEQYLYYFYLTDVHRGLYFVFGLLRPSFDLLRPNFGLLRPKFYLNTPHGFYVRTFWGLKTTEVKISMSSVLIFDRYCSRHCSPAR